MRPFPKPRRLRWNEPQSTAECKLHEAATQPKKTTEKVASSTAQVLSATTFAPRSTPSYLDRSKACGGRSGHEKAAAARACRAAALALPYHLAPVLLATR